MSALTAANRNVDRVSSGCRGGIRGVVCFESSGSAANSDPELPNYHASGLPLTPGLIELVTEETAAMITLIDIWLQNPMDGAGS